MNKEFEETKKKSLEYPLEYRRKNFVIKVYTKAGPPEETIFLAYPEKNEIILTTTPDGRYFQSISLLPEEVDKVMKALEPHSSYFCQDKVS